MIVLIANLRKVKAGRTKGNSHLWRSFKGEMSILVPKSTNTAQLHKKRACFLSCKSCTASGRSPNYSDHSHQSANKLSLLKGRDLS
eukprot:1153765-Pelagomonas_calceolata.AAC.2